MNTTSTHTTSPPSTTVRNPFPLPAILVLAFAGFISVTTELMPSGLLTQIAPDLGVEVAPAGALTAIYAMGIVLTVLPLTKLTLRMPRRTLLIVAIVAFLLSNIIVAASPDLTIALIGRFIGGASHGLLWAVLPPILGRIVAAHKTGQAMAIVFAGNSLGLAVGAPLSSLLGAAVGWRWAFLLVAVAALATAVLLWILVPQVTANTDRRVSIIEAVRIPGLLRVSTAWALMLLGHFAVFTYIAPYLEWSGQGGNFTSMALSILGVAGILGVVLAGKTPSRALPGGLIGAPALILVSFVALLVLPMSFPLLIVLLVLWGAGFSAAVLFNQQAVLRTGHSAPDTANSLSVLIIQFGIALGAAAGGVTFDALGVGLVPITGVIFVAVSAVMLIGTRKVLAGAQN